MWYNRSLHNQGVRQRADRYEDSMVSWCAPACQLVKKAESELSMARPAMDSMMYGVSFTCLHPDPRTNQWKGRKRTTHTVLVDTKHDDGEAQWRHDSADSTHCHPGDLMDSGMCQEAIAGVLLYSPDHR